MRAFSSSTTPCCRQQHSQCAAVQSRGCHTRIRHCQPAQQRMTKLWSLRAVPEDGAEQVPAAASQPEASPKPQSSLSLNSIGDGKAFVSEEEWREIDKKVNKYPSQRVFNAIGLGGDGFQANMLKAVEDVVGTVHVECVSERPSSGGKYVSVRIGPVWVESGDQVIQVFNNMRKDERLKWYM